MNNRTLSVELRSLHCLRGFLDPSSHDALPICSFFLDDRVSINGLLSQQTSKQHAESLLAFSGPLLGLLSLQHFVFGNLAPELELLRIAHYLRAGLLLALDHVIQSRLEVIVEHVVPLGLLLFADLVGPVEHAVVDLLLPALVCCVSLLLPPLCAQLANLKFLHHRVPLFLLEALDVLAVLGLGVVRQARDAVLPVLRIVLEHILE